MEAFWSYMLSVTGFLTCPSQRLSSIGFPTHAPARCESTANCTFCGSGHECVSASADCMFHGSGHECVSAC